MSNISQHRGPAQAQQQGCIPSLKSRRPCSDCRCREAQLLHCHLSHLVLLGLAAGCGRVAIHHLCTAAGSGGGGGEEGVRCSGQGWTNLCSGHTRGIPLPLPTCLPVARDLVTGNAALAPQPQLLAAQPVVPLPMAATDSGLVGPHNISGAAPSLTNASIRLQQQASSFLLPLEKHVHACLPTLQSSTAPELHPCAQLFTILAVRNTKHLQAGRKTDRQAGRQGR